MKNICLVLFLIVSSQVIAQQHNLTKKGVIAEGYDVTEYFNNKAVKGSSDFQSNYKGAIYYFKNLKNKETFDKNPSQYEPQYGGFCAYAVGETNSKVSINPKSFLIEEGKLYLFYSTIIVDTREKWLNNNPTKLKQKADTHWLTLKNQ